MQNEYNEILLSGCEKLNDEKELKKLSQAFYEVGSQIFFEIKNIINTNKIENEREYERKCFCGISGFNEYKVNVMLVVFLHSLELILKAIQIRTNADYNNNEHNVFKLANEINVKSKREVIKKDLLDKIEQLSTYSSRDFCYLENKKKELLFQNEWLVLEKCKNLIDETMKSLYRYV